MSRDTIIGSDELRITADDTRENLMMDTDLDGNVLDGGGNHV